MRHPDNGNCTVIGGFCTSVNDPICEGLHNAYSLGWTAGVDQLLKELRAEKVSPVAHGNWKVHCNHYRDGWTGECDEDYYLVCSVCGRKVWDVNQTAAMSDDMEKIIHDYPYCHCGAKMYGGDDHEMRDL